MARELFCFDDVDPYARECQDPLTEVVQDVYHRLFEEPDENLDATAMGIKRGLGLLGMLTAPLRPNLRFLVQTECENDPRISKCSCMITATSNGNAGDVITISLTLDIDADGLNAEGYAVTIIKDNNGIVLVRP